MITEKYKTRHKTVFIFKCKFPFNELLSKFVDLIIRSKKLTRSLQQGRLQGAGLGRLRRM